MEVHLRAGDMPTALWGSKRRKSLKLGPRFPWSQSRAINNDYVYSSIFNPEENAGLMRKQLLRKAKLAYRRIKRLKTGLSARREY